MARLVYSPTALCGVGGINEDSAAVAAGRLDVLGLTREQRGRAVVLQAAPVRGAMAGLAGGGVVVLQRAQGVVEVGPVAVAGGGHRPAIHTAVVADHDLAVGGQRERVLIGVRGGRAGRTTSQAVVPVLAGGVEGRAAVVGLEDLLEADVDVQRVLRVDGEHLVVPGLDADVVPVEILQRRAGCAERRGVGDLRVRPGRVARRRDVDALQVRVAARQQLADRLHDRVQARPVRGVGKRGAADVGRVDVAGRRDLAERSGAAAGRGQVEAVVRRAVSPTEHGEHALPVRTGLHGDVGDE